MKYSLKNKEFSRKKHNIFDHNPRKSRTKSTSPTPIKQTSLPKHLPQMQFSIPIKPPSLNQTAVDKLHSLDSHANSYHLKNNEEEHPMFQSFSRVESLKLTPKDNFKTVNAHEIKPSEPIKCFFPTKNNSDLRHKEASELSEPRSESFQVCEDHEPSRVNRFFAESILAKESESPMNKVVFEPVIRKSVSPDPKSLSPDPKFYQQQLNKVNPINLTIQPQQRVTYGHSILNQPMIERRVSIVQIPREPVRVQSQRIIHSHAIPGNYTNDLTSQNNSQTEEICELKKKVEQQNFQIQYLKNQKQIHESNVELNFSPKKVSYHLQNDQSHPRTPQKHRIIPSNPINNLEIDRNKLIELAEILQHNQAKIMFLEKKYSSFYPQIYQKFNQSLFKCQEILIKMFSQKYASFTEQLNAKMFLIDQKSTQIAVLDHKIDVFTNTFRSIEQNLRITKLKLQNVELLIENKQKKSDRFWNKDENSRVLLMENQSDISSIRIFNDNEMEEKDREQIKKLQKNLKQKKSHQKWTDCQPQDPIEFDSLLDQKYSHLVYNPKRQNPGTSEKSQNYFDETNRKSLNFQKRQNLQQKNSFITSQIYDESEKKRHSNNRSTTEEIEHFSPFQANEMFRNKYKNASSTNGTYLKNSQATPNHDFTQSNEKRHSLNKKAERHRANLSFDELSSKNYDFSQNSFQIEMNYKETPRNLLQKQISFTSQNMFKRNPSKMSSENEDISDSLQGEQERLIKILKSKKYQFPIECWLDEMGCLRKKNQTYIFDDQGSVIMTTPAAYKKLKERRWLQ